MEAQNKSESQILRIRAHDYWYDWSAIEEQLQLGKENIKDGKRKEITCKMLGICLGAACQDGKNHKREMRSKRGMKAGRQLSY